MNFLGNGLRKSLSRRYLSLLGATGTLLAIGFGPSVATASAAAAPEKTDIMFIFDTSGSMGGVLEEAKTEIEQVIKETSATIPNVEYGIANVEDLPGYSIGAPFEAKTETEYEEDTEKPWHLWQALTTEQTKVEEAINGLSGPEVLHDGGDLPESYGRALWETDTNPQVGWRPGARHEIVLIADNVPHTPNVNEGIPNEFQFTEPFNDGAEAWPNTGEELGGRWGIPDTQWKEGESLEFHKTLNKLALDGKPLAMVNYFHTGEEEKSNYIHYWEYWADQTGGQALEAKEGLGEFGSKLITIIKESTGRALPACPTGYEPRTGEEACVPVPPIHPTVTQVICNLVIATASDTCTATVADAASSGATNPTGTVTFTSASGGVFSAGNTCKLANTPLSSNTSSCAVQFLPPTTPSTAPAITATYSGDSTHNSSSGSTHYGAADELVTLVDLSDAGTIKSGTVDVPIDCGFPCTTSGDLLTGPGLTGLSLVFPAQSPVLAYSARHGKKKKKKPTLLGKGTLKLTKAGKGTLIIKLTGKAKRALSHVNKQGVQVTLQVTIDTYNGTLVGTKTERITLRPAKKQSKGKKHHK
jgi:hypothetical protein